MLLFFSIGHCASLLLYTQSEKIHVLFRDIHRDTGTHEPIFLMETITMMNRYDLEPLKSIAKYLAGFEGVKMPRYERPTATPRAMLEKFEKAG